jgi:5'-nucleotidase
MRFAFALALVLCGSCSGARVREPAPDLTVLSIVGTSDLHGRLRALPLLGGYLRALRRARAEDGAVLLLDAGDLFQGTLESNLEEGASVVRAYEALGYDAVAIGNHEFDYGPVGERATARGPDDDPRGALRARIREARFPFLAANLRLRATGEPADLGSPSALLERAGIRIGVVGVTTESTLATTIAANVRDLAIAPLADAIAAEARRLRAHGAVVVIAVAHAGGRCERFDDPGDFSSCRDDEEIVLVARALPPHLVDAIVAGHTHQAMAHEVAGIPIVQSYAYGVAFGRIDLIVDRAAGRVVERRIHPPRWLCADPHATPEQDCEAAPYEGQAITPDPAIAHAIAPALARAAALRDQPLGVTLRDRFTRDHDAESALGNLFATLMLRARPSADVAIVNGGGLRADLPAGPLRYGALYEAFPFDNRFATIRTTARDLASMLAGNAADRGGFFSIGGLRAEVRCEAGALRAALVRDDGRPVPPDAPLVVLTSDFLATGGDGAFAALAGGHPDAAGDHPGAIALEDDPPIREEMARILRAAGGELDPRAFFDPAAPRIRLPGARPVRCPTEESARPRP